MAVAIIETIKGIVDGNIDYHYDVASDVLYLCLVEALGRESYSEDLPDVTLVRDMETDEVVGLTIISFWKRFGHGDIGAASLEDIQEAVRAKAHLIPVAA
jgi:hypothetical protein